TALEAGRDQVSFRTHHGRDQRGSVGKNLLYRKKRRNPRREVRRPKSASDLDRKVEVSHLVDHRRVPARRSAGIAAEECQDQVGGVVELEQGVAAIEAAGLRLRVT